MLSNVSIDKNLGFGFGTLLIMLISVILFDNYTTNFTQKSYQDLLNNDLAINAQVSTIHVSLLELRRREKDFLLRDDMKYVGLHKIEAQVLFNSIDALYNLAIKAKRPDIVSSADLLRHHANNYLDNFNSLVMSKQVMGLTQNSGLQGRFHEQALLLSSILDNHNVAQFFREYLLIRRWEKDFVRTKDVIYKQRLLKTIANFEYLLVINPLDNQAKITIKQALKNYVNAFNTFISSHKNLANKEYETMRVFAHQIEKTIVKILIPDAEILILEIRNSEKDFLLHKGEDYIAKTHNAVVRLKKKIAESNIDAVNETKLIKHLSSYETAFSSLVIEEERSIDFIASLRNAAHKMEPVFSEIKASTLKTAKSTLDSTLVKTNTRQSYSLLSGGVIFILGVFTALFVIRSIKTPIIEMMDVVDDIAKGDLSRKLHSHRTDEIGKLASAFNSMMDSLNDAVNQADAIAGGDFSVDIVEKSDKDRLVIALNGMKSQILERNLAMAESEDLLRQSNQSLEIQNRLKSELSTISNITQGATDIELLASRVISALAKMTNSGHGMLYINNMDEDCHLALVGSYAPQQVKNNSTKISIGDGLIGQCAKQKKSILLTDVPTDYIRINSGLGKHDPLNILLIPVLLENELIGVIELASFQLYTSFNQSMLNQASNSISFVFNNLLRQEKTKQLLDETQRQAEELRVQQKELKEVNASLLGQAQRVDE